MINYHPSDNELLEYSAGTCDRAVAIGIASHIHYCDHCRLRVAELDQLGAEASFGDASFGNASFGHEMNSSFLEAAPVDLSADCFDQTMAKIMSASDPSRAVKQEMIQQQQRALPKLNGIDHLPEVLKRLLPRDGLSWSFVTPSISVAPLKTQQDKFEVTLQRIRRGGKVPKHDHRGTEIVLVLDGSISDENGLYKRGDYIVKTPGEIHRPVATTDKDCLCLAIVDEPVKFTGMFTRFLNPLVSVKPG